MKTSISKQTHPLLFLFLGIFIFILFGSSIPQDSNAEIVHYALDPKLINLQLYWKDDQGKILNSLKNLKTFVEQTNKKLVFAMNGGMYKKDFSPQGVFIQNGKEISPLDTSSGGGNFYLKPNGVFFIRMDKSAGIASTPAFTNEKNILYATQSGPMLVVNGIIHQAFKQGSFNLNIRNGVGILPDGKILFAISKREINFYDFAHFFKNQGCQNALYLDGFVSRMYLPEKKWEQLDGNFGVMIGVVK
jgi:uncharacterized protein YigE (DUF2233 family)